MDRPIPVDNRRSSGGYRKASAQTAPGSCRPAGADFTLVRTGIALSWLACLAAATV
jgi:hypothetical protein